MPAGGPTPHTYIGAPTGPPPGYAQQSADTSGQIAPSGMKPRVTATLWEDEGCMCFQVEAKGVCVARRDGMTPLSAFVHIEYQLEASLYEYLTDSMQIITE